MSCCSCSCGCGCSCGCSCCPPPPPAVETETDLYKTLFSLSRTRSIRRSTIPLCTSTAPSSVLRKNQSTASRTALVMRATPSSRFCSTPFPLSSSSSSSSSLLLPGILVLLLLLLRPLAHRNKTPSVDPYFLRRSVSAVCRRRVSAAARFAIDVERSCRACAVEVSIVSRCGSLRGSIFEMLVPGGIIEDVWRCWRWCWCWCWRCRCRCEGGSVGVVVRYAERMVWR